MKNKSVKLVENILLYSFLFFIIVLLLLKVSGNKEVAEVLSWISFALGISILGFKLLFWLFPGWFANKPTLNEIEEKQLGSK
jgi:hypothetical protein